MVLESGDPDMRAYAERHLGIGLAGFTGAPLHPSARRVLAMCHYNRGLLAERAEDWGTALMHYERSLAIRGNSTVREHRSAVTARAQGGGWIAAPSMEALVEALEGDHPLAEHLELVEQAWVSPMDGDRPEVAAFALFEPCFSERNRCGPADWVIAIRGEGGYHMLLLAERQMQQSVGSGAG